MSRAALDGAADRECFGVRIVYGVQSTGKGHLSRFLGLKPLFDRDGHDLLIIVTGFYDPPGYFFSAVGSSPMVQFRGLSTIEDGVGGVSKRRTLNAVARHLPRLVESMRRAHVQIGKFDPDVIVTDFDPITGSPLVAPGVLKVGIGNQPVLGHPDVEHLAGLKMERFNVQLVSALFTSGVDVRLGCHFYPDPKCLPPILRPDLRSVEPTNQGHLVVYHSFRGLLGPVLAYARRHPERSIHVYGYSSRPWGSPSNVRFETDPERFLDDLASCDAYVGTSGFQAICEAFYLQKKIVAQPIEGHYEQKWNAAQLELHGMGRWCRGDLEEALDQEFNTALHVELRPWYESGAEQHYRRILRYAAARRRRAGSASPSDAQALGPRA
ncbi:MAG: glycosyltransferase family protein [Thermotogota bacterium]